MVDYKWNNLISISHILLLRYTILKYSTVTVLLLIKVFDTESVLQTGS